MGRTSQGLREPLLAFAGATALAAALTALGAVVPVVRDNLHAPIALIFLYTPGVAARRAGREFDYRDAGLRTDPLGLNLAVLGIFLALTIPAFVGGFFFFYGHVCTIPANQLTRLFGGLCRHWLGAAGGQLRLPPKFALLALSQLVVVAIPEELFFRGYLMERLEKVWPPTVSLFGAKVGLALVVSSALFALGHLLVIPNPQRLAVFFPALVFGWMRARTGSIAAGATFHALCNITSDILHTSYFG
ncbi:MAG TPA: CPBP family intramembrane glutamic endopeptidase [Polyangia bacterium]|nr:CPBP family intramembrane glutamic endopeptidase [Polyangia bacterium]